MILERLTIALDLVLQPNLSRLRLPRLRVIAFVYDVPSVTIVEVMGRNAGWLTAASALTRIEGRKSSSVDLSL